MQSHDYRFHRFRGCPVGSLAGLVHGLPVVFLAAALLCAPVLAAEGDLRERLFLREPRERGEFEAILEQARESGLGKQTLIEAQVVYGLINGDLDSLIGLRGSLVGHLGEWDYDSSELFSGDQGVRGFAAGLLAHEAYRSRNDHLFEVQAKESLWLDPDWASILGVPGLIKDHHRKQAQVDLTVPMDIAIEQSSGGSTTLAKLVEGRKAVLLDFWATWCGPCVHLVPELVERAEAIEPQGVVVAGMNTEGRPEKAEAFRRKHEIDLAWLVDPDERYSGLFGIDSIPRMVLVSPQGKVLFNGHPMDPSLKDALGAIGVKL